MWSDYVPPPPVGWHFGYRTWQGWLCALSLIVAIANVIASLVLPWVPTYTYDYPASRQDYAVVIFFPLIAACLILICHVMNIKFIGETLWWSFVLAALPLLAYVFLVGLLIPFPNPANEDYPVNWVSLVQWSTWPEGFPGTAWALAFGVVGLWIWGIVWNICFWTNRHERKKEKRDEKTNETNSREGEETKWRMRRIEEMTNETNSREDEKT